MGKRNWKFLKEDMVHLIEDMNSRGNIKEKKDFVAWIDACANYTYATGDQIWNSKQIIYYPDRKQQAEEANRKRTLAHDEAIKKTIILNRTLNGMSGAGRYLFDLNIGSKNYLNCVNRPEDLNSEQRIELGEFFWAISSIVAGLEGENEKKLNLIGKSVENEKKFNIAIKNKMHCKYNYDDFGKPNPDGSVKDSGDFRDHADGL